MEEKVEFEDFQKLVMRIGEIKDVEKHPDADKLLVLQVDIGERIPRTIVAGIASFFKDINTLIGKRCSVVTNLTPRILRGVKSDGMLLAAGDEENFTLIIPENNVPVGTRLR